MICHHMRSRAAPLFRIVVDSGLSTGSGEAKRLVVEGGVRLDNEQIEKPDQSIEIASGQSKVFRLRRKLRAARFEIGPTP